MDRPPPLTHHSSKVVYADMYCISQRTMSIDNHPPNCHQPTITCGRTKACVKWKRTFQMI